MPLREGYTTGACAAAAVKAATMVLCGSTTPLKVDIEMPGGDRAEFPVLFIRPMDDGCEAAVRKSAGDDPDVTDQVCIIANVCFAGDKEITFAAGEGVGIVTKPGLSLPPGEPAINPVPRQMIRSAIAEVTGQGVRVRISIPGGRELAARTFNPRLGIEGGLSVLGTTGREKPFSAPALEESLKCALSVAAACGVDSPVLVPGNIGERAARKHFRLTSEQVVQVSNLWGFMLDEAAQYRFPRVLVLGHPGKLAKLLEGEWDTHSGKSASAVPVVTKMGQEVLSVPMPVSGTVEGIFQMLPETHRQELATVLSSRILVSVDRRLKQASIPAVAIINMHGDILGTSGDITPWQ